MSSQRDERAILRELIGAINEETRRKDAEPIDPLELKRLWDPTNRLR